MAADRYAIERFLFHEARLMDEHRYEEWLELWLWADDGDVTYWVPCNGDDLDPVTNVSIIYDRGNQIRNRITRIRETQWLREEGPRLRRVLGNIEIESDTPTGVTVRSNFILAELHRHSQTIWAGTSIHELVPAGDGFRMRSKKVVLINNDEPLPNVLFLL
jgi:3-phenylpropionate/cinnamic acid dioxygenase small subunit